MVAGDEYFAAMALHESDRRARAAFLDLVSNFLQPGDIIFDFGCGPGIDAKFYAQGGFRVFAFDVDARMRESMARYCEGEIASGKVVLLAAASYSDFLDSGGEPVNPRADIVTANFAPVNLVDDPHRLFEKFHEITKPHAKALISVLNPYYVGDMRYSWWWKHSVAFMLRGYYAVTNGQTNVYRRSPRQLEVAAAPFFELKSVSRGLPGKTYRNWPSRWYALISSQYLFLHFERS